MHYGQLNTFATQASNWIELHVVISIAAAPVVVEVVYTVVHLVKVVGDMVVVDDFAVEVVWVVDFCIVALAD